MSSNAGWRQTPRPVEDREVSDHPFWSIKGADAFIYPGDWMHTCDLGVLAYMHASAMQAWYGMF